MLQKLLLVLPILFMTIPTHATTLSWNQCIERAARDNAEFQVAKNNLQAAMAQQDGSYSGFLPQVSASANYSYDKSENAGRVDGPSSSYSTSLNATQNLFSGLQDKAKVDQAKANVGVSQSNLRNAQAKLSFDLKSAYMGLMFAQNSIKLTKDIMDRREANLKLVELRFTSGRENKGSLLLSKAYFEQAKYDHLQAMHSLELAQVQLQKVLGVQENLEQIEVTEAIPTSRPSSQIDIKQLVLDTPDYQQSIAQEQSASAGIVLARSSFFPSLTLTGSNGNTGDQWYPQNNHWSVGVGITFPLFNGGKDYFGTKAAFANFRSASFGKQNSLQLGMTKIKQSYNAYLEAVQKLEVDRAFVDATEIRAKVAREKYNNGLLSFDDWDTIENDLINRQKTLIQSERDRVIAEASWEQTQGKGVINE